MNKGKFIVFYGINRLGKTTQSKIIKEEIESRNTTPTKRIKYPLYDLTPTGPIINSYLREGNPMNISPFQHQELQLQNRLDYQPALLRKLDAGVWVLAEDYVLTGIAWGIATGIDEHWLKKESKVLLNEDLGILFDGEPFTYKEEKHLYENDDGLTKKCREIHLRLAEEFNVPIINANQQINKVTQDIISILVEKRLIK